MTELFDRQMTDNCCQDNFHYILLKVLCKEGLLGNRGYWEVDCEGWVVIGAACESAGRKAKDGPCGLGENDLSWGVGWAGSCYHVWHNGENIEFQAPLCPVISIYADQPAGILKFFLVENRENGSKEVRLIHRFATSFKEKLFPGFWVGRNSYCWIRKKDQQGSEYVARSRGWKETG